MMARLTQTERELTRSVERGEWKAVAGLKRERKRYERYARATFGC